MSSLNLLVQLMYIGISIPQSCCLVEQGQLVSHPKTFPPRIKALANYIHGKGLKIGIYSHADQVEIFLLLSAH